MKFVKFLSPIKLGPIPPGLGFKRRGDCAKLTKDQYQDLSSHSNYFVPITEEQYDDWVREHEEEKKSSSRPSVVCIVPIDVRYQANQVIEDVPDDVLALCGAGVKDPRSGKPLYVLLELWEDARVIEKEFLADGIRFERFLQLKNISDDAPSDLIDAAKDRFKKAVEFLAIDSVKNGYVLDETNGLYRLIHPDNIINAQGYRSGGSTSRPVFNRK